MPNGITILLVLLFYALASCFYLYSQGRWNVKEGKKEKYRQWVSKNGASASKAIFNLIIVFTLLFLLQLL